MRALFEVVSISKADGDLIALTLKNQAIPDKPLILPVQKSEIAEILGFNPEDLAESIVVKQQKTAGVFKDDKVSTLILTSEQFERMRKPTVGAVLQIDIQTK